MKSLAINAFALLILVISPVCIAQNNSTNIDNLSIAIRPLNKKQQEIKEIEMLANRIGKTESDNLAQRILPIPHRFALKKNQPIHEALKNWCEKEGWDLSWYPTKSWKVFRDYEVTDTTDVIEAVSSVVSILREEGKPIRLKISEGNRVMEIFNTEIRHD